MEKTILVHGSGHKAASWKETIAYLNHPEDIFCPELSTILDGREANYSNLRTAFEMCCAQAGGPVHLCGLSLWVEFWPWTMRWSIQRMSRPWY